MNNHRDLMRALVSGMAEPSRSRRLLAMFQAFVDESGNGTPPVFVLAGYVSTLPVWEVFSADWAHFLASERPIEYFKMNEAATVTGQFLGWSQRERDAKLRAAYAVLEKHARDLTSMHVVVPQEAYRKYFAGTRFSTPYYLAFSQLLLGMSHINPNFGIDDKIQFVFDDLTVEKNRIFRGYDEFTRLAPPDLQKWLGGMPSFLNDKDVKPLQAADLFAWWTRRRFFEDRGGIQTLCPKMEVSINGVGFLVQEAEIKRQRESIPKDRLYFTKKSKRLRFTLR